MTTHDIHSRLAAGTAKQDSARCTSTYHVVRCSSRNERGKRLGMQSDASDNHGHTSDTYIASHPAPRFLQVISTTRIRILRPLHHSYTNAHPMWRAPSLYRNQSIRISLAGDNEKPLSVASSRAFPGRPSTAFAPLQVRSSRGPPTQAGPTPSRRRLPWSQRQTRRGW